MSFQVCRGQVVIPQGLLFSGKTRPRIFEVSGLVWHRPARSQPGAGCTAMEDCRGREGPAPGSLDICRYIFPIYGFWTHACCPDGPHGLWSVHFGQRTLPGIIINGGVNNRPTELAHPPPNTPNTPPMPHPTPPQYPQWGDLWFWDSWSLGFLDS